MAWSLLVMAVVWRMAMNQGAKKIVYSKAQIAVDHILDASEERWCHVG
jgi:hypothetical protein